MPRPDSLSVTTRAAVGNAIAASQTPGGAGNLTIDGANATGGVATATYPCHVTIASNNNDTGRTFTVYGTNRYGVAQTETITGPNNSTATGSKNFKTVTRIAVDAATAGAITAGFSAALESQWLPLDRYSPLRSVQCSVSSGATVNYTLQWTANDVQSTAEGDIVAVNDADIASETTSQAKTETNLYRACRVKINTWSIGSVTLDITQGNN